MNKSKKIILGVLVGVLIGSIIGITYAIFSYTATSRNEQLITGDIYMHYKESNTLTLENALPSSTYDSSKYFEFTIDGKNTNTLYDIYYDILLNRGDVPTGKQETNRIQDKFIKFRLTEFVENETTHELVETEIFTNKSYSDLSSAKRVHVATIPKNTMSEITHRYRLYMWIGNDVVIGNTGNSGIDYDMTTWNNLFASIKVSSTGDFEEKEFPEPTSESCFTTTVVDNNIRITGYDETCGTDIVIPAKIDNKTVTEIYYGSLGSKNLTSLTLPNNALTIFSGAFQDNQLTRVIIPENVTKLYPAAFSNNTLLTYIEINATNLTYSDCGDIFNFMVDANNLNRVLKINSKIIPSCFKSSRISELELGSNVENIDSLAFASNKISSLTIPSNVKTIGSQAFTSNQLSSVTIPSTVETMYCDAFGNQTDGNGNSITTTITYENPNFNCIE